MAKVKTVSHPRYVEEVFKNIPSFIDGTKPDRFGVGRIFWNTFSNMFFRALHKSYEVRSQGGTDELGNSWKPLSTNTIAQRPIGKGQLGELKLTKAFTGTSFKDRKRGLLTPEEDAQWRKLYAMEVTRLSAKMNPEAAKVIAAKKAWAILKKKGAVTKIDKLGGRDVLIMRVTDRIYNSLAPSKASETRLYTPAKDQIWEKTGSRLLIGTAVPYAKFHADRPIIPDNANIWVQRFVPISIETSIRHIQMKVIK